MVAEATPPEPAPTPVCVHDFERSTTVANTDSCIHCGMMVSAEIAELVVPIECYEGLV